MYIDLSNAKTTIPQALTDQAETYRKQLFSGTMENTGWVVTFWTGSSRLPMRSPENAGFLSLWESAAPT